MQYLKKSSKKSQTDDEQTRKIVSQMLAKMAAPDGEQQALAYAKQLDGFNGRTPIVSKAEIDTAIASIPKQDKQDIQYAYANVSNFAKAQKACLKETEVEVSAGVFAGHVLKPVKSVGAYVPGGRYAHIATAIMTITTAKIAGVENITACSPPTTNGAIHPHILYTMDLCGADTIVSLGGVQGIATMTNGFFGIQPVDMLVGPGNRFVAEAKRILFGQVGIDQFAGPTEIAIIADKTADSEIVAVDLVGQCEHGFDSPAWLFTTDKKLAERVIQRVPQLIAELPDLARQAAEASWADYGEVILCQNNQQIVEVSDKYAAEHLEVQAENLPWWLDKLSNYGSLFLGEETTVAYGDKCSGTNHVLPTKYVARYTGGLSVHKFIKVLSYQRQTKEATQTVGRTTARISRLEGMEAHARTADIRIKKYLS